MDLDPPQALPPNAGDLPSTRWLTRRRLLGLVGAGLAGVVAAGVAGVELIEHGVLPGKLTLDELDGGCDVTPPTLHFGRVGPSQSGRFASTARRREVGYTIAWPPGHGPGSLLPLVVMLHGDGSNHASAVKGMTPAQLVALEVDGKPLPPMAIVTVDGGNLYWHPHPDDDPMGMVVDELIPYCRAMGLGRPEQGIGAMGISMGGYGALILAEHHPGLLRGVAAISPAIWTTYAEAQGANARAYTNAEEFDRYDAVTHASSLEGLPIRIASGADDPFHPGVVALTEVLPRGSVVDFANGCHTESFFIAQEPAAIAYLGHYLGG